MPVAARLGQPPVMAEMVAGLLLGPSLLGWLAPEVSSLLFPSASLPALSAVGQIGVVVFMFLVGWRLEIETLKSIGHVALVTSVVSITVPFALGSAVAVTTWYQHAPPGVALLPFALFMGSAMSMTAFPVLVRILADQGLTRTRIGVLAVTCAAFNDAAGWLVLAAITTIVRAGAMAEAGWTLIGLAIYLALMFGVIRPLVARVAARPGVVFGRSASSLAIVVAVIVASAYTTHALGVHALFGAFLAGVVMPRDDEAERLFGEAVEPATTTYLLPLFFAFSGLRTSIDADRGARPVAADGVDSRRRHGRQRHRHGARRARDGRGVGRRVAAGRADEHARPHRAGGAQHRPGSRDPVAGAVLDDGRHGRDDDPGDLADRVEVEAAREAGGVLIQGVGPRSLSGSGLSYAGSATHSSQRMTRATL